MWLGRFEDRPVWHGLTRSEYKQVYILLGNSDLNKSQKLDSIASILKSCVSLKSVIAWKSTSLESVKQYIAYCVREDFSLRCPPQTKN